MTLLLRTPRSASAMSREALLTRVPLSAADLPSLDRLTWPWPGRSAQYGDLEVYVRETPGPRVDAPRAVYLHGLGGSATNWTELAGLLAGHVHGFAVDLPGFGLSPPSRTPDYRMAKQAEAVVRMLDGGEPAHLIGNSMGGGIALLLAAARPDLVRTLTLISPAMPDLRPDVRRLSDPRMAVAMLPFVGRKARAGLAKLTARDQIEQMLHLCFADPGRVSEERIALAVAELAERNSVPWAGRAVNTAASAIFRDWLLPAGRSLWAVARRVTAPTLVVWGAQDKVITVRKGPRTARLLPRGRLLVLPRTGHTAQMERPVTVARAVLGMWEAVDRGEW
ncbi:MAG TPA: alpha/beta hydrolase [Pseudonocardiaceae bacterium]|nr:alpha/beta hydrolase [Pseudonocardiaceae bacterium]